MLAANGRYAPLVLNGRMRLHDRAEIRAQRAWYRLFLIEDGLHEVRIDAERFTCEPGSCYLVHPGTTLAVEKSPTSRAVSLDFAVITCRLQKASRRSDSRAQYLHEDEDPQPSPEQIWGIPFPTNLDPVLAGRFRPLIQSIAASWWWDAPNHYQANRRLAQLLDEIYEFYSTNQQPPLPAEWRKDWFAQLLAQIEERLPALRTAADLIAISGVSSSQLHREFTRHIGQSPGSYLRQRRLNKAAELMTEHNIPIARVSDMLGYSSQSAFGNAWRQRYGMSPSKWKRLFNTA